MLWPVWVVSTTLGALAGGFLGDPKSCGFDFVFTAIFIGLIAGLWKGRSTALVVLTSGIASALAWRLVGPPWQVAIGALAGIIAAAATTGASRQPAEALNER